MRRLLWLVGPALLSLTSCDGLWLSYQVPCTPGVDCPSAAEMTASDPPDLAQPGDGAVPADLTTPVYWVQSLAGVQNTQPLRGIGGAGGQIFAVGDAGTCLVSSDGKTWTAVAAGKGTDFYAVWASAADNAWLVGIGGARIYQYNGTAISAGATIPSLAYSAVAGVSATQVIAVGVDADQGAQYTTLAKWTSVNHNYNAKQYGMWGLPGGNRLWTVGETATGGYFDVTTKQWSAKQLLLTFPSFIRFTAIWGTTDTDVWAVGDQGSISHYAGAGFVPVPSNSPVNLNGVWGLAANNIWAVGDAGTIMHYDGKTWQPWTRKKDVGTDQLLAIWGNQTNLWTVSAQGNIFRYR